MRHFSILIGILFLISHINGQTSGTIKYTESRQLDIQVPDGMDIDGLLGNSMTTHMDLFFSPEVMVYRDSETNENEDMELSSDDGSIKMVLKTSNNGRVQFTNLKSKKSIYQTDFMGKVFLVESDAQSLKWKLTDEKIKYLGYVCHKAELTISEEGEEDRHIVAWFTSEIPVSIGPDTYGQLPGAILMINENDGENEIRATEVILEEVNAENLEAPTKGKRVSEEEFDKIVEEKMKEMEGMHGPGGVKVIRG